MCVNGVVAMSCNSGEVGLGCCMESNDGYRLVGKRDLASLPRSGIALDQDSLVCPVNSKFFVANKSLSYHQLSYSGTKMFECVFSTARLDIPAMRLKGQGSYGGSPERQEIGRVGTAEFQTVGPTATRPHHYHSPSQCLLAQKLKC